MTDEVINIDSMPIEIDDNYNINNVIPTLRKSQRLADKKMNQAYAAKSKGNLNIRRASQIDATNTKSALQIEFETLLEKETFFPVHRKDLTQEQLSRNISGFTFLKKKLKVDGKLDKWKARFVAGGDRVDTEGLGPLHSYTVQLATIFLLFSLAAQFNWKVSNSDVTAAYLNTKLPTEQQIPMILGPEETNIIISIRPHWSQYVLPKGTMQVLVIGGLYGLPQSALLWYNALVQVFLDLGYCATDTDKACFVKYSNSYVSVIVIHVDDILHFYNDKAHDSQNKLQQTLTRHFGKLTTNETDKGLYLGLEYEFNRQNKSVELAMTKYTNKLLQDFNVQRDRYSPCSETFTNIDSDSPRCNQNDFASIVMTIYYMAMRTRPDLQVYCAFLASRIHECNDFDMKKVHHLLSYIKYTKQRSIILRSKGTRLQFSMDASYNIHQITNRSYSGLHVTLGGDTLPKAGYGGPIVVLSHSQKLVASSSCEAEIIAVFVYHQLILSLRSLMSNLGFDQQESSVIHQDNQSTIQIFTRGSQDCGSTRHLQMRISRIYELYEDNIITFQ